MDEMGRMPPDFVRLYGRIEGHDDSFSQVSSALGLPRIDKSLSLLSTWPSLFTIDGCDGRPHLLQGRGLPA